MKLRLAQFALIFALAACQRTPTPSREELEADRRRQEQIQALDDKIAQLQDMERQANERKLAESERKAATSEQRASAGDQERQRLEREKQVLLRERERLADAQEKAEREASEARRRADNSAERANQERQDRTMDLFYTALDPHGEWMEIDRYGYVWQPNAASNPRWRPYTEGRWVFTEYGWTWKSNEPFGWAAYHYGRWARIKRVGWVWVPGTEWGPGWVSWRRGDRFVGWAPLPPEAWSGSGFNEAVDSYYEIGPSSYTFVPVEELGQQTYVGRVVEPERNVTIVNQTVNVTNIKYTNVQNTTVVYNGGPELSEVNARAEQKIPRLNVERITDVRSGKELGRAEQRGNTLVLAAPQIAPKKASERPTRVKEQVKAPEVERGWTDVDRTAANEARARITNEARQTEERLRKGTPARQERAVPAQQPPTAPPKTAAPATPVTEAAPATPRRNPQPSATPAPRPETAPERPAATPAGRQRLGTETRESVSPEQATPPSRGSNPGGTGPRDRATGVKPGISSDVPTPPSKTEAPATPQPDTRTSPTEPTAEQRPMRDPLRARQRNPPSATTPSPATQQRKNVTPPAAQSTEAIPPVQTTPQPASRLPAPGGGERNSSRPERLRPGRGGTPSANTPAAAPTDTPTPATAETENPDPNNPAASATPDRRPPKAKRPRPATAATPPAAAPIPTEVPSAPEGKAPGKRKKDLNESSRPVQ